jgi:hypothetical protein
MSEVKIDTKELDRIVNGLGWKPQKIVNRLAYQVEVRAKQFAPFEFGALRNSGKTTPATENDPTAVIGFYVEYAAYQELGTYKMGAQPYLLPAVQTIISQFNAGETWRELFK